MNKDNNAAFKLQQAKLKPMIDEMLTMQNALQRHVYKTKRNMIFTNFKDLKGEEYTKALRDNVYFFVEELHEMGREVPYMKPWKTYLQADMATNYLEWFKKAQVELIDAFHFLLNIYLLSDLKCEVYIDYSSCRKANVLTLTKEEVQQIANDIKAATVSAYESISYAQNVLTELRLGTNKKIHASLDGEVQDALDITLSYILSMGLTLGLDFTDVYNTYIAKNKVNFERQNNGY